MNKKTKTIITIVAGLLIVFVSFIWIYPFLWMISASFKSTMEIFQNGLSLIPDHFSFDSYVRAWVKGGFSDYFFNSVLVTVWTIVIVVVRCMLAGYVLGMYDFKGKSIIMTCLVATFLIPTGTTIIPIVEISNKLGLLNSRTGVILALAGGGHVASIFLYKAFFANVPKSISEAARIDGAGFFTVFARIMVPMTSPVTATTIILTFMAAWNNFMIPLVFTFGVPQYRTLPVGMMAFQSVNETDWSGMAAAGTLALLPIVLVFIALQKYFINGIAGAVKE
ncbi:MAG: carbohydrate ABC transporter permease [Sphaerochaetaceae bacterium]|nr:carbohydrate ABC transporter permease [Sphaerochaetaceae bacterium]